VKDREWLAWVVVALVGLVAFAIALIIGQVGWLVFLLFAGIGALVLWNRGRDRDERAERQTKRQMEERRLAEERRTGQAVRFYPSQSAFASHLPQMAKEGWKVGSQSSETRQVRWHRQWVPQLTLTVTYVRSKPERQVVHHVHEQAAPKLATCGWCRASVPFAATCAHCGAPLRVAD
jgi:hypothetical protein